MENENQFDEVEDIQENSSLGSIQINNEVVANIVAMAAREVAGVHSIASGGLRDDIAGFLGRKDSSISISEDAQGRYIITVKVILYFGVQLAKVAADVQVAVRDQVENMTNKEVAKVNILVDGVRTQDSAEKEED